ncbi:potassium/proton antiporter [Bacillus fonticola]|uniref:potassium/proton antiporter n=1 Tax=Bacillus fonticola TaxID=2728853 RepID=UPI0014749E21|nr:potassium/proton antiporter [Bacillus fonticola]
MLSFDSFMLLSALLLIVGVITTKLSSRLGVPALVLFIAVGMVVGSDGLGLIYFDNAEVAEFIGVVALVVILFEGGLQTKWKTVKPIIPPSLSLATLGVIITSTIVAVAVKYILGVSWTEALLFGSIVGSTDAAAVFAILKGENVKERLGSTLEAESGTNDPMAIFLTVMFIEVLTTDQASVFSFITTFFWQMGIGLLIGIVFGKLATYSINKIQLDSGGLYPVFALAFAFLTYSVTDFIQASGLLAVYVTALIIGNQDLSYRQSIIRFHEGFAWMMQILMFILLGLLVFPNQLFTWDIVWNSLLISFTLLFIARPVAVFLSLLRSKFSTKEKWFLSWAGLRGAVPIVLATYPLTAGIENSQLFFNVVFFVVLTSCLLQGSTISYLARKLNLVGEQTSAPFHTLELVSIGKANAELVEYTVKARDSIANQQIRSIPIPKKSLINAIIRNDQLVTPKGHTVVRTGDILFILTSKESKDQLKKILKESTPYPVNEDAATVEESD